MSIAAAAFVLTCAGQSSIAKVNPDERTRASELDPAATDPKLGRAPVEKSGAAPSANAPPGPAALREATKTGWGSENQLLRFRGALAALGRGELRRPVRILWFGDSHTAADFMTGAVREALWKRYPPGGPGFLRIGLSNYRHDQASLRHVGRFLIEPDPPSRRARWEDGDFGLGGLRALPFAKGSEVTVKLAPGALRGRARHTLLFDLPARAAFEVSFGDRVLRIPQEQAGRRVAETPVWRLDLEGDPGDVLKLSSIWGRPRFFGLIVEGSEPGVVLDTVGIDGARLATLVSWRELPFVAEVATRPPDLLVLAYGTNEAFDGQSVQPYARQLTEAVRRLRRGAPGLDCLVVGPPDALTPSSTSVPRIAEIAAVYAETARSVGCAFLAAQELMGGAGAFLDWLKQQPPLARRDRIHLTALGYRTLGARIASVLLQPPKAMSDPGARR